MSRTAWTGRSGGKAGKPGRGQPQGRRDHPVAMLEEGPPGAEMERRLHADDPVGSPIGEGQPGRVTYYWHGASRRQPPAPGGQLQTGTSVRNLARLAAWMGSDIG